MNTLDNLLLEKIGSYLDNENCCMKSSLDNWTVTNQKTHEFVKGHFKMKTYKQVYFRKNNSVLKWKQSCVCTKCFSLRDDEIRELVHLKGCAYHHDDDEKGIMNELFRKTKKGNKIKTGSMYIHFHTPEKVKEFASKLPKLLYNVECRNEYCCNGNGVRVIVHYE